MERTPAKRVILPDCFFDTVHVQPIKAAELTQVFHQVEPQIGSGDLPIEDPLVTWFYHELGC